MISRDELIDLLGLSGLDTSLRAVDDQLRHAVEEAPSDLGRALVPIASGGKRLRAALVFACASHERTCRPEVLKAMCAIELLHVATLVHDDIIDNSEERRGVATVSHSVGLPGAVVAGDRLIAQALRLASECSSDVLLVLTDALVEMCDAQFEESRLAFDTTRPLAHVLGVADGKTARLFEAACRTGGLIAELSNVDIEAIGAFGRSFGLGFQLLDDLQDLSQDQGDIREGIFTDAIVSAIEQDRAVADLLLHRSSHVDVLERVAALGAVDTARRRASECFTRASKSVSALDDSSLSAGLSRLADAFGRAAAGVCVD